MSLEAWGDEGDLGLEGYVTEELYEEQRGILREAVGHLRKILPALSGEPHAEIARWLAENTVNGGVS